MSKNLDKSSSVVKMSELKYGKIHLTKEEKQIRKLQSKNRKASKCIATLKNNLKQQNEEIEKAYVRLNEKDNEIRELKRKLSKQYTINTQYREIVTCLELIIDEMRR